MQELMSALHNCDLFTVNGNPAKVYHEEHQAVIHWEPGAGNEHFLPLSNELMLSTPQNKDGSFELDTGEEFVFYRRIL